MENLEKSNIFSSEDITISFIHSTNLHILSRKWNYSEILTETAHVYLVLQGEYNAYVNGKRIKLSENELIFLPQGYHYRSESITEKFSFMAVYFKINESPSDFPDGIFSSPFTIPADEKMKQNLISIHEEMELKNDGYLITVKALLYNVLQNCFSKRKSKPMPDSFYLIKNAVSYIKQNYSNENVDVNYLAEISGVTPTHFINVFKGIFGKTPKSYIIELRMEKAKQLLMYSPHTVSEVAALLGYPDVSCFSNAFKSYVGMSPLSYRKKLII